MSQITLLHPSRGRPEKAFDTYNNWMSKRKYKDMDIQYSLSLDTSDPTVERYKQLFPQDYYNFIYVNDNKSVVEATNHAAHWFNGASNDLMIYLSDDFDCPQDWDYLILREFLSFRTPMLLKVDDCLQPFPTAVVTIPIMNRAFYLRVGYFWYPEYKSMFCDEDLYWTASGYPTFNVHARSVFELHRHLISKHEHIFR